MKELLKKPWLLGLISLILVIVVFLINFWILNLSLIGTYEGDTIWWLGRNLPQGRNINIFSFALIILFFTSVIPLLLSFFSFFRKRSFGYLSAIIFYLIFNTTFIAFQSSFSYLSVFSIILIIFNIILLVFTFVLLIFRKRVLVKPIEIEKTKRQEILDQSKIPLFVLILDVISIIFFLTTFFIPLYSLIIPSSTYDAVIIRVLLSGSTNYETLIYFIVSFAFFLSILLYFADTLSNYFFDKEKFIEKSKLLVNYIFITTVIFFITGLSLTMFYQLSGDSAQTISFIPMILMSGVIFVLAIFKGKYSALNYTKEQDINKVKYSKVEPLFYVILLTTITVLMMLLPIVKISIVAGGFTYFVDLTGFAILRDYASLEPGYRIIAFILVVMLLASGLSLLITITSYLSKYSKFNQIVKFASGINVFFVFIVSISGYYFQIAKEINIVLINEIFDFYGVTVPGLADIEYIIGTQAIYALIASAIVLSIMFVRKAFEYDDQKIIEATIKGLDDDNELSKSDVSTNNNGLMTEETYIEFDPCPALTDIDSKIDQFNEDLENRKSYKTNDHSLNDLVSFIVDYAKNSRLHLSYTEEDIATFVSGLGAARLSILQGMSGTGKTSLPKIFSEAIFGNCEIIEVESSWKDKNELLGYYNEFSMKYTPKKFTLALYKAALNKEIFTFILLDEMNLSRIEYYFSDFLSLMENEENQREIKLINIRLAKKVNNEEIQYLALDEGNTLKVSPNVWFIGTANRDESTFVISDKVYDRAHTMNFTKRAPKVRNYSNPIPKKYYDYKTINNLFEKAKAEGNFDCESSQLIKSVEELLSPFNISFGNRILKQIEDFVNIYKACFPNDDVEKEAIEKILLSKVVSKLEVKTIDDKEKLESEFEKLNLLQCMDFVRRLDNE